MRFMSLQRLLSWMLNPDILSLLTPISKRLQGLLSTFRVSAIYEDLKFEASLELLDTRGNRAIFHKRQHTRFLQNYVIAYYDRAFGDGDIFADYQCSPGVAVDRYQIGAEHWTLISLRQIKHRGDKAILNIDRTIKDGFTRKSETFQLDLYNPAKAVEFSIVFPAKRPPKQIRFVQQHKNQQFPAPQSSYEYLSDGRVKVLWQIKHPRQYQSYVIAWEW